MALGGVSVSDLKTFGFNTVVCAGVVGSCAAVAWLVKKLALMGFARFVPAKAKENQEETTARHEKFASMIGLALGLGAAFAAYKLIPTSRFALVANDSNSKALKLGVIQFLFGFMIDCYLTKGFYNGMAVGVGSTAATRFAPLALPVAGLGLYGAAVGAGYLQRPAKEANQ